MAPDPHERIRHLRRQQRWRTTAALTLIAAMVAATGVIVGWWPMTNGYARVSPRRAPAAEIGDRWRNQAACVDWDPELWFPVELESNAWHVARRLAAAPAVAICHTCPVTAECLAWALEAGCDDGIWGATLPGERRAMRRAARQPADTPAPPPPSGRQWTAVEERLLRQRHREGATVAQIAAELGRTVPAVRTRRGMLDLDPMAAGLESEAVARWAP